MTKQAAQVQGGTAERPLKRARTDAVRPLFDSASGKVIQVPLFLRAALRPGDWVVRDFKDTVYPFFEFRDLAPRRCCFALVLVVSRFFESRDV